MKVKKDWDLEITIETEYDVTLAVGYIMKRMEELRFSEVDKQKVVVSVSELTRNILNHTDKKGLFSCYSNNHETTVKVEDNGPGIKNIQSVLQGITCISSTGLGVGLSSVKRLMDDVRIETSRKGTKIIATKRKENK